MLSRILSLFLLLVSFGAAQAEPRTALVIGNTAYSYAPLTNPVNDATDVAEALGAAGFEVILRTDADQATMDEAIAAFGDKLREKGGVGFFYFSGHGVQVNGENYMLPIGDALTRESDVKYKAINSGQITDAMAGTALNIVVLDSCRNNPLASSSRSATRGLARVEGASGLFVSFATSPGAVALDGEGRNSPYTKHLVAALKTPGLSLEETFKRTLKGVHQETNGEQTPWISSSFFGDFVFLGGDAKAVAVAPEPPATAAPEADGSKVVARLDAPRQLPIALAPTPAGVYRAAGINPNGTRYQGMVAIEPEGSGYRLTWWIGRDVYKGTGRFAGRMLVVEWGAAHPVIYTFGSDGVLDGEWADGTATETLALYGEAADGASPTLGGRYKVRGRNPDGSSYSGSVEITPQGSGYGVDWTVGNSAYHGEGMLAGNVLTVDWGSETPVIYALSPDGILSGLWAGGAGEETLTPDG